MASLKKSESFDPYNLAFFKDFVNFKIYYFEIITVF